MMNEHPLSDELRAHLEVCDICVGENMCPIGHQLIIDALRKLLKLFERPKVQ